MSNLGKRKVVDIIQALGATSTTTSSPPPTKRPKLSPVYTDTEGRAWYQVKSKKQGKYNNCVWTSNPEGRLGVKEGCDWLCQSCLALIPSAGGTGNIGYHYKKNHPESTNASIGMCNTYC